MPGKNFPDQRDMRVAISSVAIPAAAHFLTKPSENHLGDTLRSFGYLPDRLADEAA